MVAVRQGTGHWSRRQGAVTRARTLVLLAAVLGAPGLAAAYASAADVARDRRELQQEDVVAFSGWQTGTSTFYGGPQDKGADKYDTRISTGSCGYGSIDPKLWPFYLVAGLSPSNPLIAGLRQNSCGSCLEIECTGGGCHSGVGPLQALITDQCAEGCDSSQVNLHVFGFEMLAPTDLGSVQVKYRRVACSPVDPIAIHIDAYRATDGGWLRLALKNVGGDGQITDIFLAEASTTDLKSSDSFPSPLMARKPRSDGEEVWKPLKNTFGAAWELNRVPTPPLHMKVTNALGQTIVIANAILKAGALGDIETHAQFPPPPPPSSDSTTDSGAPPSAAPPGATLAPGTSNVFIFSGPSPEPFAGNATSAATNGASRAAGAPGGGERSKGGAGGGGASNNSGGGSGNAGSVSYDVAGFVDVNGDGLPDEQPAEVGMPTAPAGVDSAGAAKSKGYQPAPANAGGPQRLPRPLLLSDSA